MRDDSWEEKDDICQHILKNAALLELLGRSGKAKAARHLNISSSAVSGRLKPLARMVGGPIVESKRNGGLAPLGKVVRKKCEPILAIVDEIADGIERLHNQSELRLAISRVLWDTEGARLESTYARLMPEVSIHPVFEDGYFAIQNQVRDGVADIGIVSGLKGNERLESPIARHSWREDFMVLVAPPDSATLIADLIEVKPSDLKGLHHRFFTMPEHNRMQSGIEEYIERNKISRFFRRTVPLPDIGSIIDRVNKGHGVSILPEPAVKKLTRDLNVAVFLLNPFLRCRTDCLYRTDSLKRRLVSAFFQCLEQR